MITKYQTEVDKQRKVHLVEENKYEYGNNNDCYCNPDCVEAMMRKVFAIDKKAEEYIYLLALDTKTHLIGVFELSHGTVNTSLLTPREIFVRALQIGAVSIILVHNHPSGDPEPSKVDFEATKRVKAVGELIGIDLLDHIVIGYESAVSIFDKIKEETL